MIVVVSLLSGLQVYSSRNGVDMELLIFQNEVLFVAFDSAVTSMILSIKANSKQSAWQPSFLPLAKLQY